MTQKLFLTLLNIIGLVNNLDNFLPDENIRSFPVAFLTEIYLTLIWVGSLGFVIRWG